MIKGHSFYAIWDEPNNIWTTKEARVAELIDNILWDEAEKERANNQMVQVKTLSDFSTKKWNEWTSYCKLMPDTYHTLNNKIIFADTNITREDYATFSLSYSLNNNVPTAYNHLISTLYSPEERQKIEWAIGSIIRGDSKKLQKFIVLYGDAGSGKSTILNIIQSLFEKYWIPFNAKELTSSNNSFALEQFKTDPLIAIQHDGDLSRIEDNTLLNSLISHESMTINEKFKSKYQSKFESFLFMASNTPVKITNTKSGMLRRLIDVYPSGNKLDGDDYLSTMAHIQMELGSIAKHCLDVYDELGFHFYDTYRPKEMFEETNDFFNFMYEMRDTFKDGTSLKTAWMAYKDYCEEAKVAFPFSKRVFKVELKGYFHTFETQKWLPDGTNATNYYSDLIIEKFDDWVPKKEDTKIPDWLNLSSLPSKLDEIFQGCKAQYAIVENSVIRPEKKWVNVNTHLSDINTNLPHYVQLQNLNEKYIVIDLDCRDSNGNKSINECINAVISLKLPETYVEASQSGNGLHLHYFYDGDVHELSNLIKPGVEIKVYSGDSALRRKLSVCNSSFIAHISSGLPLKEHKKMLDDFQLNNEKQLRYMIIKNLNRKYHASTKPSIDYIYNLLTTAYENGLVYDVSDMRPAITYFASKSTHQANYCLSLVNKMPFKSEDDSQRKCMDVSKDDYIFFDVEVFPNVFIVCWKYYKNDTVVRMINPSREAIETLMRGKLIGFNNRKYDNHILYAWLIGYDNEQLFKLSQRIINNSSNATLGNAYNISYTDVYDFCSKKQSLKKWEIELNMLHLENAYAWDEPLPEDKWDEVAAYCENDVKATEAVFIARKADFKARLILSDLSGLSPNDTTRMHATKIIFGSDKNPKLVYTDLATIFPGYIKMEDGKTNYMGEDPGNGGYVYAEPGIYTNVALLDIASMHPTSIELLNLFGEYTARFSEIKNARILIKHKDYETAKKILDGKLEPYLTDDNEAKDLSQALKIVINSVYGYTTAKFDNPFKDPLNVDNIVAKRGALFMINLKHEVQSRGYIVSHIKTDSIKIPNADENIIQFVMEYGKQYGYTFEHEDTYERMCLVNDAVYIAKKKDGQWTATGTQFQVPYVFKTLFSKEAIDFTDLSEAKSVSSSLYLDFNENLQPEEHDYVFVGKVGLFTPVKKGYNGGELLRANNTGGYSYVTGTKGYRWKESSVIKNMNEIDYSYYNHLVDDAIEAIDKYAKKVGISVDDFISNDLKGDIK